MTHTLSLFALAALIACGPGSKSGTGQPNTATSGSGAGTGTGTGTIIGTTNTQTYGPQDLITDRAWPGLRLEIDYVEGKAPNAAVLADVQNYLDSLVADGHIDKPSGIELVLDDVLPAGDPDAVHTFADLDQTLRDNMGPDSDGDFVVIHGLWTDGHSENDGNGGSVLGFAYGLNRLVILPDNIQGGCDTFLSGPLGLGQGDRLCEVAEATVILHEVGHLFGLVNNGTPMVSDHQDADHGAHDTDSDCLMYWAVENSTVFEGLAASSGLGGPQVKELDANCLADLDAAQLP